MDSFKRKHRPWDKFKHLFNKQEIKAKTILLNQGDVAKEVFFIKKGCLRVFFQDEAKDITFQFFFEGEIVCSIESLQTNKPSFFTIQSIEDCVIYSVSKKDLQIIIDSSPIIKTQIDNFTFDRLFFYQKLFLSYIKETPEKRYLELLKNNPKVLLRVPQHYIASFLGITPVSLSRIRNRR